MTLLRQRKGLFCGETDFMMALTIETWLGLAMGGLGGFERNLQTLSSGHVVAGSVTRLLFYFSIFGH